MTTRIRRKNLASKLGVAPSTLSTWKTRYLDFPQPIGRYYDLEEVTKWKAKHDVEYPYTHENIRRTQD